MSYPGESFILILPLQPCALVTAISRDMENCHASATCSYPVLVLFIILHTLRKTVGLAHWVRENMTKGLDNCQSIREVRGWGRTERGFPLLNCCSLADMVRQPSKWQVPSIPNLYLTYERPYSNQLLCASLGYLSFVCLLSLRHMVSDTSGLRRLLGSHPSVDLHCQAEPAHHEDPEVWVVSHHPSYDHQQVSSVGQRPLSSVTEMPAGNNFREGRLTFLSASGASVCDHWAMCSRIDCNPRSTS